MQQFRCFPLAAALTILLGLPAAAQSATDPATPAQAAAHKAALSMTHYLSDHLHLSQAQALQVRDCTRQQLLQALADPSTSEAAVLSERYDAAMAAILTPAQYQEYTTLKQARAIRNTVSQMLAAR